MAGVVSSPERGVASRRDLIQRFHTVSRRILRCGRHHPAPLDFIREVSELLLECTGCDALELRLAQDGDWLCCRARSRPTSSAAVDTSPRAQPDDFGEEADDGEAILAALRRAVGAGRLAPLPACVSAQGSFWWGDVGEALDPALWAKLGRVGPAGRLSCVERSVALVAVRVDDAPSGLLELRCDAVSRFDEEEIELLEGVAETIASTFTHDQARSALEERVKELSCLYGISQVVAQEKGPLGDLLQRIVALLPPGWLHPALAQAQITLDRQRYATPGYRDSTIRQRAAIQVAGRHRGWVEVTYPDGDPGGSGPRFLREERSLIDAVGRQLALIVERREAAEGRAALEEQIRHAHRLATIGELAAGVAHELNEPLGNILGFAQLARKDPDLPTQPSRDLDRIVEATLHAREVIRKLLLFARQAPAERAWVDLDRVVSEGLYFFESRCAKSEIQVVRELAGDLPRFRGDPAQMNQVLINLVVNAIQAMPDGGTLRIGTHREKATAVLFVEDSGGGMSEGVQQRIFMPFFTTKDVQEGTGLGLSVVHGIVAAHGGAIEVQSVVGQGSRFEIRIPAEERS